MPRKEFSKATKAKAWLRAGGRCEECDVKLFERNVEYHHDLECTFAGSFSGDVADVGNCVVLCRACHRSITRRRRSVIAKSNRQRDKHLGLGKRRSGFRTNRDQPWKRKLDGTIIPRY